ncbi:unnamed protein product [Lactuca saligna]|uniref:Uncharacterized protein n=1 Tax=Lactuca saligna TaxID=75948 RepID=A0AA35Y6K3_LACSI|nr:unnamed protein product [Lactuca saligna]
MIFPPTAYMTLIQQLHSNPNHFSFPEVYRKGCTGFLIQLVSNSFGGQIIDLDQGQGCLQFFQLSIDSFRLRHLHQVCGDELLAEQSDDCANDFSHWDLEKE